MQSHWSTLSYSSFHYWDVLNSYKDESTQGRYYWSEIHIANSFYHEVNLALGGLLKISKKKQRSKSWHSGSFAKYSDLSLVTISFPACCVSHRATELPVMVHDMHTRRRRPDYLQACPTRPPVDGVKSALTPALWPFCSDPHRTAPNSHNFSSNLNGFQQQLQQRTKNLRKNSWRFCRKNDISTTSLTTI